MRIGNRLLDVLDRDQTDTPILIVDHQQLFDAVLMQEALGVGLSNALAHGDQPILGHKLGDLLAGIGGEPHVAVGENADELAGASVASPLNHRDAGNAVVLHQSERVRERGAGIDRDRIDHHAGLELLDLADLRGLLVRLEIAVDDAQPSGLRHGDRHLGFGHGVHGRGDDRDIERNVAGDAGADVGVGREQL